MKILYIGSIYAPQTKKEIISNVKKKIPLLTATDLFQRSLIKGFVDNNIQIDILTVPPVPSYPFNYCKTYINNFNFQVEKDVNAASIGHCTIPILKSISIFLNLLHNVTKIVKRSNADSIKIVIYSPNPIFLLIANLTKFLYFRKHIFSSLIIGDILVLQKSFSFAKKVQLIFDNLLSKLLYGNTDYFILLSKHLKDKYPKVIHKKTTIVEGIYSPNDQTDKIEEKFNFPVVLYTGSLQEFTGIKILVDAFMKISNPRLRLMICGSGFYSSYVEEMSSEDDRICYKGNIDREEVLVLQKKAKLLVNPRQPDYELTKYSFPSKTMEYLASGTPVLMYKLPGIPEEYFQFCYTLTDLSVDKLASKIEEIVSQTDFELQRKGGEAKRFILENKTARIQVKKIIDLFSIPL